MLNGVLKRIKPTKAEEKRVHAFSEKLIKKAEEICGLEAEMCGSIGKGTWLKGDHDIDLFIIFPRSVSRADLEKKGLSSGKRLVRKMRGKYIIKYAEHPYVHADIRGFGIDIVPCYRIKRGQRVKSAVDRSPLHLAYIKKSLKKKDDVRLLKQFCKGIDVYGSDARHLGFSGYLCELLVIRYGSFKRVLQSASKWTPKKLITLTDNGTKKFKEPLVFIDPTDSNRNVAANLSNENLMKFISASKKFLKKSSRKYFFPKTSKLSAREMSSLKKRESEFIALVMKKPDVIDDTLYPQMRRAIKRIETLLRHNEFVVLRGFEYTNKDMIIILELEVWELTDVRKMVGPPIYSKEHSNEFLDKYKEPLYRPYVEDGRWIADKERDFKTATKLIKSVLKKKRAEMEAVGIPNNIAKKMRKARLLEGKSFWSFVSKKKDLSIFLRKKYFSI